MGDATSARVRLRDLSALGRSRPAQAGFAGPAGPFASRRRPGTDTPGIGTGPSPRPSTPSSRPGTDALVASPI